jgi:hypothetical protein
VLGEPGGAAAIAAALRPSPESGGFLAALDRGFDHAARGIRYVSIQLGIGGYKPRSPAETEGVAYGDCKAKTMLLRSLVEQWGGTSYPVLVRTDDLGPVVAEIPTPAQFNHMIAAVALPEGQGVDLWTAMTIEGLGRIAFLDPTAALGGTWDLPSAVQGTTALLVHPGGGMLVTLPVRPPSRAAVRRHLEGRIDDRGTLVEARLRETWVGAQAAAVRGYWAGRGLEDRRLQVARDLQGRFPGAAMLTFEVHGLDDPAADVRETTSLAGARLGKVAAGGLLIIEPGAPAVGLFNDAFPSTPLQHPLDLGLPREESVESRLAMPDGWFPEDLPPPLELDAHGLQVSARWSFDAGHLVYRRTARLLTSTVAAARSADVRRAALQLGGADRAVIVFVRRD